MAFNLLIFVVWGFLMVSFVLGRMMDPPNSVIVERNPRMLIESARRWRSEFYETGGVGGYSRLEHLDGGVSSSSINRGFDSYQNSRSYFNNDLGRINTRHFDLADMNPSAATVKKENLSWMLKNIFAFPRSHSTNETSKETVKKYIADSFKYTSGLDTSLQHFQPIQFLNIYEGSLPVGSNIVGIFKGENWGTPYDRPILVGAHFDTVDFSPGTDDNGSGVSAMLEAARVISHSNCRPKHSLIFVAFDLEEVGSQGSLIFIKSYLTKILNNVPGIGGMAKFQGAFILDTIMNFNSTAASQTFSREWSLLLPDVYNEVANEQFRGDFLSLFYRNGIDNFLAENFIKNWGQSQNQYQNQIKFKVKKFPLNLSRDLPDLETLANHLDFLRSDHSRFWYMNDSSIPHTFNAVLLTDTGPFRGAMKQCYHFYCDSPEVALDSNPENLEFLVKITETLRDTLMEMSECKIPGFQRRRNLQNSSLKLDSPFVNFKKFLKWIQK